MPGDFFRGKRVYITGITGFKGSWLACWLKKLGADVSGYALDPPTEPSHFSLLNTALNWTKGDLQDREFLRASIINAQPEIVFHLAAQSLVRRSYADPHGTFMTNVMGTLNVFEACGACPPVKVLINVSSDKCYLNRNSQSAYREDDRLGGHDPYSTSKACAELLTSCFRDSFFNSQSAFDFHNILLASCRSGNVIGGGDWAEDRLIPDMIRATLASGETTIRYPEAVRPWMHVLEPLRGYMLLAKRLFEGKADFASAWNFSPSRDNHASVREILDMMCGHWPALRYKLDDSSADLHEASFLYLDSSLAAEHLGWAPVWSLRKAVEITIDWYRSFYEKKLLKTLENIDEYEKDLTKISNAGGGN